MARSITIGRIVLYRSRTGNYTVPAIVAATKDTLHQPNVDAGLIPDLTDEQVHLVVFSPGPGGLRASATDFVVESPHGTSENQGGTYTEYAVPHDPSGSPGTYRWPDESTAV